MIFHVSYRDENGALKSAQLSALTRDHIATHPAFEFSLESIRQLPDFFESLLIKKLPLDDQLLLLSQISAHVRSAGDVSGIRDIIEETPKLRHVPKDPRYQYATSISDILHICGVDKVTVMIVQSGERGGNAAPAIESATLEVEKRAQLARSMKGDVSKGVFYVILGIMFMFGISLLLSEPVQTMMRGGYISPNSLTHMMIFISQLLTSYLIPFVLVISAITYGLRSAWQGSYTFRRLPGIAMYDNYRKTIRSLNFLTTWRPMYLANEPFNQTMEQVRAGMSGLDLKAIDSLIKNMEQGQGIYEAMDRRYWSISFMLGMKPFTASTDENKRQLLYRIQELLETEIGNLGKKLGKIMLVIGMVAMLIAVMFMTLGFYFPMIDTLNA